MLLYGMRKRECLLLSKDQKTMKIHTNNINENNNVCLLICLSLAAKRSAKFRYVHNYINFFSKNDDHENGYVHSPQKTTTERLCPSIG